MQPSLRAALCVAPHSSVRAPCLLFSRSRRAVSTFSLVETQHRTRVNRRANLRSKGQRSRSRERKCENRFLHISSSKVDRFTSNQDQNDRRPIVYISPNTFLQQKCFVLTFDCNYPGWPCHNGHLAVHLRYLSISTWSPRMLRHFL